MGQRMLGERNDVQNAKLPYIEFPQMGAWCTALPGMGAIQVVDTCGL
jgi:hypothetical protein